MNEFDMWLAQYHVQEQILDPYYCRERLDQWAEDTARRIVDYLTAASAFAFRTSAIPRTLSIFADGWDSKKPSFPSVFNNPKYFDGLNKSTSLIASNRSHHFFVPIGQNDT